MNFDRVGPRAIVILVLIIGAGLPLMTVHRAHAVGTVSIDTGGLLPVPEGTPVSVNVRVDGMDSFNAWDIAVETDTGALNGTSINIKTQTVFPQGSILLELENCINGDVKTNCPHNASPDGMGIVHSAVTLVSPVLPQAPVSGILFTINYIAGKLNFTNIHFVKNEIVNPNDNPPDVPNTPVDGAYGTPPPDFSLTLPVQSLAPTEGSSVATNITASSVNAFAGQVNFTSTINSPGISVVFAPNNVTLNNSTATAQIAISVLPTVVATSYTLNITGTSIGSVHYVILTLRVQTPGAFEVGFTPQELLLPQSSSGTTTVVLTSQRRALISQEFSGMIDLRVVAPRNAWTNAPVNASLGATSLYLPPGGANSTTLTISVPSSPYAYARLYAYLVNVTAIWASNPDVNVTQTATVEPPAATLFPTVTPDTLTIVAGQSGFTTLYVTGPNYFVGSVFASSTMTGGAARFNESSLFLGVQQTIAFSVNITISASTEAGTYAVLLTAYSGTGVARSALATILVKPSGHSVAPIPIKIFGLTVPIYFGILSAFAVIFVALSVFAYRRSKTDRDEWD